MLGVMAAPEAHSGGEPTSETDSTAPVVPGATRHRVPSQVVAVVRTRSSRRCHCRRAGRHGPSRVHRYAGSPETSNSRSAWPRCRSGRRASDGRGRYRTWMNRCVDEPRWRPRRARPPSRCRGPTKGSGHPRRPPGHRGVASWCDGRQDVQQRRHHSAHQGILLSAGLSVVLWQRSREPRMPWVASGSTGPAALSGFVWPPPATRTLRLFRHHDYRVRIPNDSEAPAVSRCATLPRCLRSVQFSRSRGV